ncbi:MAG: histidine--tRNA ligase [Gemmatimonadota bacterium]|nr:histidine--tRNA ligase [Gemmatimonadota bacterium]
MDLSSLPGFRDFYPEQMALRRHIEAVWRSVAARYGFVEYEGPPLEPLDLYVRKSGDEIVGQLYRFTDQGGREVALRPEMTPTFARMVGARAAGLPKPIRWFSLPQLFRYERPQKGRLREHVQLNLDIVGEAGPLADAEVLAAAIDVLREFGLREEDVVARVSDRALVAAALAELGLPRDGLEAAFVALDKRDRQPEEWVSERLRAAGATPEAVREILGLRAGPLAGFADRFGRSREVQESAERLAAVLGHLEACGLGGYVRFDPGLVRGLAYYTGTVFELWDRRGELRAICGGGRYDGLLAAVGGPDLPAVGFGMGDVVLGELLAARGLVPEPAGSVDDFVVCVTPEQRAEGLRLAHALRATGRRVGYDLTERSVGRQFKAAGQAGAGRVIVLGPRELEAGEAVVRDMETGEERRIGLAQLARG